MPQGVPQQSTWQWKRVVAFALLLLAGGAILNIAVAWGCAIFVQPTFIGVQGNWSQWPVPVPSHWPDTCGMHEAEGTGCRVIRYKAYDFAGRSRRPEPIHMAVFSIERTESGWPLQSLRSEKWRETEYDMQGISHHILDGHPKPNRLRTGFEVHIAPDSIMLPLRPIFPGFLINAILCAALLWLLIGSLFALLRVLRRKRGLCEKCAYPIGTSPVCTECGAAVRVA